MKDVNGHPIEEGNIVSIVSVSPNLLEGQTDAEAYDPQSMLGEHFEVEEIDGGRVWISKWWEREDGGKQLHSLSFAANEIEFVKAAS